MQHINDTTAESLHRKGKTCTGMLHFLQPSYRLLKANRVLFSTRSLYVIPTTVRETNGTRDLHISH